MLVQTAGVSPRYGPRTERVGDVGSAMEDFQELVQRTEGLRQQVEGLRQTLDQLCEELTAHRKALAFPTNAQPPLPVDPMAVPSAAGLDLSIISVDPDANRRSVPRRLGNPVPVLIGHPQKPSVSIQGWILDRSPEGLSLLAVEAVAAGTILKIRPIHHLPSLKWFTVEVRNCRSERSVWILGCRFDQPLSWDELRLFH